MALFGKNKIIDSEVEIKFTAGSALRVTHLLALSLLCVFIKVRFVRKAWKCLRVVFDGMLWFILCCLCYGAATSKVLA